MVEDGVGELVDGVEVVAMVIELVLVETADVGVAATDTSSP